MSAPIYGSCRECGSPIPEPSGNGRLRLYCSKKCATRWKIRVYHCREYLRRYTEGLPVPQLLL